MNTPTYQEQEKHLHEQYIAGLILPLSTEFCFCGNLLGGRVPVGSTNYPSSYEEFWPLKTYTCKELNLMEDALFKAFELYGVWVPPTRDHPNYENALFNGMVAALEVLKQIHISKGEIIDTEPVFEKRELATL